jgi:hypothetical protein
MISLYVSLYVESISLFSSLFKFLKLFGSNADCVEFKAPWCGDEYLSVVNSGLFFDFL